MVTYSIPLGYYRRKECLHKSVQQIYNLIAMDVFDAVTYYSYTRNIDQKLYQHGYA